MSQQSQVMVGVDYDRLERLMEKSDADDPSAAVNDAIALDLVTINADEQRAECWGDDDG